LTVDVTRPALLAPPRRPNTRSRASPPKLVQAIATSPLRAYLISSRAEAIVRSVDCDARSASALRRVGAMRRALIASVLALVALACAGGAAHGAAPVRVLFVGNSLTAANDLPAVVATLSHGAIAYRTVAPGGVSLEDHWNFTGARDALDDGPWDYVVLQQGPSTLTESALNLREWAVRWADAIRARNATPAVYEVWPDSQFGVRLGFPAVVRSYRAAADAAHAVLLPAGEAWQAAWRRNARLALYGPDGFHPSRLGTTLAALVITARLTRTPPTRIALPYPAKTAKLLRAAAAEALRVP